MKDKRYKIVKSLISTNELPSFAEIFTAVPVSVVAKDIGVNYTTLYKKVNNPKWFNLNDFQLMAKLFDCDIMDLIKLAVMSLPKQKR